MDGASWPARWPPPPPAATPPPLPSQMDSVTLRHLLRPFAAQEAAGGGRATAAPEQLATNPSTAHSGQPARAGPSNELLAQIPGSYSTFGLAPGLTRANAGNAADVIDLTRASPLHSTAAILPNYPRHGMPASSGNEQSSNGALFLNRSDNGMVTFTGEGSTNEGISNRGVQFLDSSAHALQKLPFRSTTHQHPTLPGDRIRVACLNIGGEFFVGEAGRFGVICLCHRLRMSVAKFCEHAGGTPEKAGEIVRMENGMSIAQWFKFCIGVGGSITNTRWDWPEWASMKSSPEEYMLKSLASRNNDTGKVGLLGRYGKVTGPINKPAYSSDLYIEGGGCTNVDKLVNRSDEANYRMHVDVHEAFTKNSALLQSSTILNSGLTKNHMGHAFDVNPLSRPSGSLDFEASMGRHYNRNHLGHSSGILLEKNFDASFRNPGPHSTRVPNHGSRACRLDFPHKLQDTLSNASNTELKLGQSSYHQSMTTLFPSGQSTVIEFDKPQSHRPSIKQNPCPKQATKVNRSLAKHNEPSISTGNKKQPLEAANGTKHSEGDEPTDDTSKNSFISLFLSHLERNSAPEPIDDILNSNEHYFPKALDVACGSDHPKIASRQIETRVNDNHSWLAPAIINMERRLEDISLSAASSGYNTQDASHANSLEHLFHGDYPSHLLPSQPNVGTSKVCARVSCPANANCMSCSHAGNKSNQIAHGETGVRCFYDKMARGHGTFERADDFCTHRGLRGFAKISSENGKSCCCSREYIPSFCQNDQSTLGKPICGCCCKIQEDVSKLGFIPGHSCRAHFSSDLGPVLDSKPTLEGLDEHCACSSFTQKSLLCSREHALQSSCHACPINGLHYRSSMGHAADSLTKHSLFDALNSKERGPCCNGRCCYSVVPTYLSGCSFTKHCDVRLDQNDHSAPKGKHQLQLPTRCCTLGENEKLTCQCLSNKIAGGSFSQTSHCKDVSDKVMNQPSIAITERLKNVSETSVADDSSSKAATEKKGVSRDSAVSKRQTKFGLSSGSSSIVVTKFQMSPEFNNLSSTAKQRKHKNLCDEGSRIEKYSASSYAPTGTGCEEAPNNLPRSQLGPSRVKSKCSQISDGSRLEEKDTEELWFGLPKKTRMLRSSGKSSESDDCTRASSQSSQKGGGKPQNEVNSSSCRVLRTKRKHPTMHLDKPVKRLHNQNMVFKGDHDLPYAKSNFSGGLNSSDRKQDMTTQDRTEHHQGGSRVFVRKLPKYVSLNCIVNEPNSEDACSGSVGIDSSLIATGIANDNRKSPKIVPLNLVLKRAKRSHAVKLVCKTESSTHLYEEKSSDCSANSSECSIDKYSGDDENCSQLAEYEMYGSKRSRYSSNDSRSHVASHRKTSSCVGEDDPLGLTDVETNELSTTSSRSNWTKNQRESVSLTRIKRHKKFASRSACYSSSDKDNAVLAHEVNVRRYSGRLSSDAPCCVCGISGLEPCNQLIECSNCYVKVHQACYGVLKVPRGQWFCRPCKTNTLNAVCVLCGYGGGAMTRALKTKSILKSLLKGLVATSRSEKYVYSLANASSECTSLQNPLGNAHGDSIMNAENITSNFWTSTNHYSSLLRPRTMQWVHMVCGLWTPGTKCPNATTMSAFDVSGASPAKRNTACSICNRSGGSFIKCRDVNCSVIFHPWCAHQKGLLQSEPEGERNQNVGFYGRCVDHAIDFSSHVNPKKECLRSNKWTCARTEGFKGRKGEGCPCTSHKKTDEYNGGEFSVSQEQINAWLRINGSKPCGRGQKEYIHYKQLKGWKHLVVYKSGIHGLGLYTSVFIPRGSMVVEYVGEIVGQRVADKREKEYQSGKRQQYKSACYFFKIDKEHIVDATRKGGIARFVNHSCQPNCVAKIISVRNEKKVMFFAERHINPGEEITYDYHFNREDEGQRIPCFCRSRYCRRYLN